MKEITNADSFEMNMDNIFNAVVAQLCNEQNVDFNSEATDLSIQGYIDTVKNVAGFDEELKLVLLNSLYELTNDIASDAFTNGLRIGLSVLKNLITAEMPVIHTVDYEIPKLKRRCKPVDETYDVDEMLTDYLKKTLPYLEREQKFELQGRIESIVHTNTMKKYGLF